MIETKKYLKPKSTTEALEMAQSYKDDFKFIAGGTDLMVNKFQGNVEAQCLIDLSAVAELKGIHKKGNQIIIGADTHLYELQNNNIIQEYFPTFSEVIQNIGSPVLRKMATIGGNLLCENRCSYYNQSEWWREAVGYCLKCDGDICIATGGKKACFSKFVSDAAIFLISVSAKLEIVSQDGTRTVQLEDIYTGDGINSHSIGKIEIIKNIILPANEDFKVIFKKLRPREAVDFSSLTTSVSLNNVGKIKIALGGVDPKPVIVEGEITGDLDSYITQSVKKARIIDNDVFPRLYRKRMISTYLTESLNSLK